MRTILELQAIDGSWYTFTTNNAIDLKAGARVEKHGENLYSVTESIWRKLTAKFEHTSNF